ncbi:MAG: polysaccharide biosynthesis protein, partial [Proteobacteria bacterium]|nr:polysaccharide biosynthesis protein [Pseudomonadota bacterium]
SIFLHFAADISNLVFGEGLRSDAAQVMPWVAAAAAIGYFKNYYLDVGFQLARTTSMQLRITAVMAFVNIAMNFLLIPKLGGEGAAISTFLAMVVGAGLSCYFGTRHGIYPPLLGSFFAMLAVASTAVATAELTRELAYVAHWRQLLGGVGGALGYFVASLATNLAGCRSWILRSVRTWCSAPGNPGRLD